MILTKRSWTAYLLVLVLLLSLLMTATVRAQDEPTDPPEEVPSPPSPSPTTDPITDPITDPTTDPTLGIPSPTGTTAAPPVSTSTPTPKMPDPIFSASDSCTECKPQWASLSTCLAFLPPNSVNLTVITSVLPFFSCICKDNMAQIDTLATCSTCLRNTGQLAFLHPMFYNVTQSDTRAYRQACLDTKNGSSVPPDSAAAAGLLSLHQGGAWVLTIALAALGVFLV